jgi:hypothetical protein
MSYWELDGNNKNPASPTLPPKDLYGNPPYGIVLVPNLFNLYPKFEFDLQSYTIFLNLLETQNFHIPW